MVTQSGPSMYAAYEALSDNLKVFLDSLNAVHSSALADVSKTRRRSSR